MEKVKFSIDTLTSTKAVLERFVENGSADCHGQVVDRISRIFIENLDAEMLKALYSFAYSQGQKHELLALESGQKEDDEFRTLALKNKVVSWIEMTDFFIEVLNNKPDA